MRGVAVYIDASFFKDYATPMLWCIDQHGIGKTNSILLCQGRNKTFDPGLYTYIAMSNAETPSPVHKLIDLLLVSTTVCNTSNGIFKKIEEKQHIIAHEVRGIKRKWNTRGADQDELAWNQLSYKKESLQDGTVQTPNPEDFVDLSPAAELGDAWVNDEEG